MSHGWLHGSLRFLLISTTGAAPSSRSEKKSRIMQISVKTRVVVLGVGLEHALCG